MTTIVAVKKNGRLCMAADSLTYYGSRKELANGLIVNHPKIISFQSTCFGSSGHASWTLVLQSYFSRYAKDIDFSSLENSLETLRKMHVRLKEEYFLVPQASKTDLFESSEFTFLFANTHGIFEVEWDRTIRQYKQFAAIGSGDEYALGAMQAAFDLMGDAEEIARIGIEAAAKFDLYTELPVQIRFVIQEG
jgi:ATP-dependent protease HslVU (ClpYQ) peptidase subunit